MIRGVLWDMDGLMFDTERIGLQGWQAAAEALDLPITNALVNAMRGTGTDACRRIFNDRIPGQRFDEARAIRVQYAADWIRRHGVPVKPGLRELLHWLQAHSIPSVLATSTARATALDYLAQTGVTDCFAAMVFGPEVARPKPAPDIFLAAAAAIGVPPAACLVLEDSPNGLQAAKAAGCRAIVVPDLTPAPPAEAGLWDHCVASLQEVIPLLEQQERCAKS